MVKVCFYLNGFGVGTYLMGLEGRGEGERSKIESKTGNLRLDVISSTNKKCRDKIFQI